MDFGYQKNSITTSEDLEEMATARLTILFEVQKYGFIILTDRNADLYWKSAETRILPLHQLPWKLQMPFFLKFLHDDRLAERFKDLEILAAIDIYIKSKYFLSEELGLER